MNAILWILQGLLAAIFIMPGFGKICSSKEQHIADGHIAAGASVVPVRILGVLEWLGCIGIIVPWLTGIMPLLTPLSATGFGFIMVAGLITHTLKREYKMIPLLSVILILSVAVAYFRFRQLS